MKRNSLIAVLFVAASLAASTLALGKLPVRAAELADSAVAAAMGAPPAQTIEAKGTIEVAFSPDAGATETIVKAIAGARESVLVQAYSFTSAPIARALADAKARGVEVKVVLDRSQSSERYTSATWLANHDIPVRIDAQHGIAHNKVMIIDGDAVVTGSFNFTKSAEVRNAENVLVLRGNPDLAKLYSRNWRVHWAHSDEYRR